MNLLAFALFVATIPAANYSLVTFGLIPGLMVPWAVLIVGAALVLRDALHESGGRVWVAAGVAVGAALSVALASPGLALASGLSFLAAETADFAVYDRVRRRSRAQAVLFSGLVAAPIDTVLFICLAGLPWQLAAGMTVGKLACSVIVAAGLRVRAAAVAP